MPIDKDQYSSEAPAKTEQPSQSFFEKARNHSFSDYLDGSIIAMVAVLFVAMIFTYLVQIIFDGEIDWKDIGVNTLLLSVCTIAIYLLLRYYAQRKGRRTQAWGDAYERLQNNGTSIITSNFARLVPKYCRMWEEEYLNSDIEAVLLPVGLTLEEFKQHYCQYSKSELKTKFMAPPPVAAGGDNEQLVGLTKYQVKAIMRAKRIKRAHFDEHYFFVNQPVSGHIRRLLRLRRKAPSGGLTTKTINRINIARIMLTTLAVSLLSVSLFKDIFFDFSAESIIKCVIKLAVTIFFGVLGMISGYSFTSINEVAEMNARSDEIETFKSWCEKNQ